MPASQVEVDALRAILVDSCLFQAHPYVTTRVREGIHSFLVTIGRQDLADIWADDEALIYGTVAVVPTQAVSEVAEPVTVAT